MVRSRGWSPSGLVFAGLILFWGHAAPGQVSGPIDYRVRSSFGLNTANLFVTGNVTAGRSLRAFSPIRDASSLAINSMTSGTTTSLLSDFRRDSVGLQDVIWGRTPAITSPYFSREQTATSLGTLAAFNRPRTPGSDGVFAIPQPTAAYTSIRFGAPYAPELGWARSPTALPAGQLTLASPAASPFMTPIGTYRRTETGSGERLGFGLSPAGGPFDPTTPRFPIIGPTEKAATTEAERTVLVPLEPADLLSPPAPLLDRQAGFGLARDPLAEYDPLTGRRPIEPLEPGAGPTATTGRIGPAATSTGLAPGVEATVEGQAVELAAVEFPRFAPRGADVYEDMIGAYSFMVEQQGRGVEIHERLAVEPSLAAQYEQSFSAARQIMEEPAQTHAGSAADLVQRYIRAAEERLRDGEYYQARSLYQRAAVLDRRNPLVLMGQGHAMLAAGEYYSAAQKLSRAVELFPAIAFFRLELTGFITEPDLLEKRRADLERRLERREDYRFRFVLGYAEYYSGLETYGLENLRKAAEQAPEHSGIARLHELLTMELPELPEKAQ